MDHREHNYKLGMQVPPNPKHLFSGPSAEDRLVVLLRHKAATAEAASRALAAELASAKARLAGGLL